jgi:hypothetical protein
MGTKSVLYELGLRRGDVLIMLILKGSQFSALNWNHILVGLLFNVRNFAMAGVQTALPLTTQQAGVQLKARGTPSILRELANCRPKLQRLIVHKVMDTRTLILM